MYCKVFIFLALLKCMFSFVYGETNQLLVEDERVAITKFFNGFVAACNEKDVESVKTMSGKTWGHWSRLLSEGYKFEAIEVLDVVSNDVLSVIARVSVVDGLKRRHSGDGYFMLSRNAGKYTIVATDSMQNQKFDLAHGNFAKLIGAIRAKDIGMAKDVFVFSNVADFDAELTARGLSWIKDAVNSDVVISGGWGVNRSGKDGFVGHVEIAHEPGGTNVLREVIFKGLKIDRAAPPKETYEEFCKRFEAEKEASRKKYEEQWTTEQKKMDEQFLERIRKQKKLDGAGAK